VNEAIQLTRLKSGLTVVTERMERVETVSLGAYVATGSRHELETENGVSHFLEHMAFKGTERRSAAQIAEEIEAVGGHINAYTAREQTAYYVKVLKEDTALGADIIGDILTHSTFEPEEMDDRRNRRTLLTIESGFLRAKDRAKQTNAGTAKVGGQRPGYPRTTAQKRRSKAIRVRVAASDLTTVERESPVYGWVEPNKPRVFW